MRSERSSTLPSGIYSKIRDSAVDMTRLMVKTFDQYQIDVCAVTREKNACGCGTFYVSITPIIAAVYAVVHAAVSTCPKSLCLVDKQRTIGGYRNEPATEVPRLLACVCMYVHIDTALGRSLRLPLSVFAATAVTLPQCSLLPKCRDYARDRN